MSQPGPQTREETGRPARYQRSFGGLVGSMIVMVVVLVAFVLLRGAGRDDADLGPERVDYLGSVALAQDAGRDVVYPARLPDGWVATGVDTGRTWGVSLLSGDERFVGVRQSAEELDVLVERYVDARAEEGRTVTVEGSVAPEWRTWTDAGGDTAYSAEVDRQWVIVFGSAPADELLDVVRSLTLAPV